MKEIDILRRATWLPPAKHAQVFELLGAAHGFFGRADEAPDRHHARQVHGTSLALAEEGKTGRAATVRVEADAVYTRERGTTIAVKTADCLPLVLCDGERRAALAIHAGWRGLVAGIIGSSLDRMANLGVAAGSWRVVIGPAIGRDSYEVGPEVIAELTKGAIGLSPAAVGLAVAKGRLDRWHLDLTAAAVLALADAGVPPEQIHVIQADTYKLEAWYSFRRDGKGVPSNWSWITL